MALVVFDLRKNYGAVQINPASSSDDNCLQLTGRGLKVSVQLEKVEQIGDFLLEAEVHAGIQKVQDALQNPRFSMDNVVHSDGNAGVPFVGSYRSGSQDQVADARMLALVEDTIKDESVAEQVRALNEKL